jgi:hypothetical protein
MAEPNGPTEPGDGDAQRAPLARALIEAAMVRPRAI